MNSIFCFRDNLDSRFTSILFILSSVIYFSPPLSLKSYQTVFITFIRQVFLFKNIIFSIYFAIIFHDSQHNIY